MTALAAYLKASIVVTRHGCWQWTRAISDQGYPRMSIGGGRYKRAHIVAYEVFVGPIPDGLVLDHLCRLRSCINPEHLEAVTIKENVLRGTGITAINARKTKCLNGHPYGEDSFDSRGHRTCKVCRRLRAAARHRADMASRLVGAE